MTLLSLTFVVELFNEHQKCSNFHIVTLHIKILELLYCTAITNFWKYSFGYKF